MSHSPLLSVANLPENFVLKYKKNYDEIQGFDTIITEKYLALN